MLAQSWIIPSMLALFFWGVWGFLSKLCAENLGRLSIVFFESIPIAVVGLILFLFYRGDIEFQNPKVHYPLLAGGIGLLGNLCMIWACNRGPASLVVTITALYPVITLLLCTTFLGESLTLRQLIGIVLALIAMLLLSK